MENIFAIEKKQRLQQVMQGAKGNSLDIYCVIYKEYFLDNENPGVLFRTLLEFPDKIGVNDGISENISSEEESATIQQYRTWLMDSIALLMKPNDPEELFYENLWQLVFCSPTSPKDVTQCAILLKFLNEEVPVLPYYQATQLLQMGDDEFSTRKEKLQSRIREAVHMLNRHFQQRTQEASQLYRLGADLESEDAIVYWSTIICIVQGSAFRAGADFAHNEATSSKEEM